MSVYRILNMEGLTSLLSRCRLFNPDLIEKILKSSDACFIREEIFNGLHGAIEYSSRLNGEVRLSISFENGFQPVVVSVSGDWMSIEGLNFLFSEASLKSVCAKVRSLEDFC